MYLTKNQVLLIDAHTIPCQYRVVTQTTLQRTRHQALALTTAFNNVIIPFFSANFQHFAPERDKCFVPSKGDRKHRTNCVYINVPYGPEHTPEKISEIESLLSDCVKNLS